MPKEISSKHADNSRLHKAVTALKKDNYEGMKLVEPDRRKYNALSGKEIETF